ncbi:MAG: (Fe-S)-binding protein, partial [Chloroflexi bacterium]|nr:(Fe-S)-binding protein [Chloroflexota bacterium]
MSRVKEISTLMREFENELVLCMRCGMCQSVCPLFEQTRIEADVARGKLTLLEGLMNNLFDNPDGVNRRLAKCLLCGSCAANCPSGVNVVEIFIKARSVIAGYAGLSFAKKIIFRKMLARPALFDKIVALGAKLQNFFLTARDSSTKTASVNFLFPMLKKRRISPVADVPFHANLPDSVCRSNDSGPKVAFFAGCLIDKIYPDVGRASIKT